MNKNQDFGILIIRLMLGGLMLFHGIEKLKMGIAGIELMLDNLALPAFLSYGVYIGEIIVPILLILGIRTRMAALILAFNMIIALVLAHSNDVFSVSQHGGWAIELQALYLLGSIALYFTGGGKLSLSFSNNWD